MEEEQGNQTEEHDAMVDRESPAEEFDAHLTEAGENLANNEIKDSPDFSTTPSKAWYQQPHFWWGFIGWFFVNSLLWVPFTGDSYGFIAGLGIMPINILTLIILAAIRKTRMMAFGILMANAINLVFTLVMGVVGNSACFAPFYIDIGM